VAVFTKNLSQDTWTFHAGPGGTNFRAKASLFTSSMVRGGGVAGVVPTRRVVVNVDDKDGARLAKSATVTGEPRSRRGGPGRPDWRAATSGSGGDGSTFRVIGAGGGGSGGTYRFGALGRVVQKTRGQRAFRRPGRQLVEAGVRAGGWRWGRGVEGLPGGRGPAGFERNTRPGSRGGPRSFATRTSPGAGLGWAVLALARPVHPGET